MKPNFDWKNLSFDYIKTNSNIRYQFSKGVWGEMRKYTSDHIDMHMAATCLHYGQECFEGLKAFKGKDGKVRIFRLNENAKRMNDSAREIFMPEIPKEIFKEAVINAVKLNQEFVPPYESGASLYIRPLLIGTGPRVGLNPADEYMFIVFVNPVGPYFKNGFKPISLLIDRDRDRAAPLGVGHVKVGGNYAASFQSMEKAHKNGYDSVLFLDPKEKKYIDECGPANFFAIKEKTYITPESKSILPSITNKSLMTLAEDMGLKVERRKIELRELEEFDEVGACGTAAVIGPVGRIVDEKFGKTYQYCHDGNPGTISTELYNRFRAIQYGDESDKFDWVTVIE
ncbi:MAG: branched-chain amino acid aminotransferase [Candidatus Pacebacteria bacterium]|nr:branched-chain amino acid aminotransferase [Candidatus Paceibacterota bacterium]